MRKPLDMLGKTYGFIKVIGPGKREGRKFLWECLCTHEGCNKVVFLPGDRLRSGRTKSCGCYNKRALRDRALDLTGLVSGKLTVLGLNRRSDTCSMWDCRCECGSKVVVEGGNLKRGRQLSCGCLKWARMFRVTGYQHPSHEVRSDPLFSIWVAMIHRCHYPSDPAYKHYGGRGIKVCERWMDPGLFICDMTPMTREGLTIGRIDNEKGYSPDNCRWETFKEQSRNHRGNHWLIYKGDRRVLQDWESELGLPKHALGNLMKTRRFTFPDLVEALREGRLVKRSNKWVIV